MSDETTYQQLTLCAGDFHVSRTASRGGAAPAMTTATSGPSSPASFASLSRDGLWLKMSSGYCQVTMDSSLEAFSATWPRSGMVRNGTAYELVPLVPRINESASLSWPTPTASDWRNGSANKVDRWLKDRARPTPNLRDFVAHQTGTNTGHLNPAWLEWLTGFPIGWTDCER